MTRPSSLAATSIVSPASTPRGVNPFATPTRSVTGSHEKTVSTDYFGTLPGRIKRRKFQSARLRPDEYDVKPWPTGKDDPNFKRKRLEKVIFVGPAV
jgi:hypothetical protein